MPQRFLFFDLLRCIAAITVVAIHVLTPYKYQLGELPFYQWFTAIAVNGSARWAVPVFILITGALLLSDRREFEGRYYIKRRLAKVVVPFIVWSVFYAFLSGWQPEGFELQTVQHLIVNSYQQETYYHLGFFYYFIPLYLIAPAFHFMVRSNQTQVLNVFVLLWLITSCLYLFSVDGIWSNQLWLYSGYLPLGYILFKQVSVSRRNIALISLFGIASVMLTITMVTNLSLTADEYRVGRWLSYKTINTIVIAAMVFLLCRAIAPRLPERLHSMVKSGSRYSLGIYLLHPLFLWPVKFFGWDDGNPVWMIPFWTLVAFLLALLASYLLSRSVKTRWLVP
ncbi:acyltransferase [Vibrio sp. SCSIO 43137]|uniref:acyltransferase n=1 Tax=Vibrio sp. SCSIO 43137 TaxID=3021011 RepID=UPI002307F65A|nr:acyltransferase [Vibrio sp. SCSIO 43137]WCE29629.1 acyltransferase [Vibrio sp. SCSIO 43137]